MKTLSEKFTANFDKSGEHEFIQRARNENVAVYERRAGDKTLGFEVFQVKTVKAGTALPGGNVVAEDYEAYPRAASFGKTAFFVTCLARALELFEEMKPQQAKPTGKRGRVRQDINLVIPNHPFLMEDLQKANPDVNKGTLYIRLREKVDAGEIDVIDEVKGGRGKPKKVYEKA